MKLQIRTKDNLEDLLRHRNSPSWVISESRVSQIEEVEIYQFDGKKVIKGTFDIDNSSRTESGRLIVAFKNALIEDCDHKWIGQNPIKYDNIKYINDKNNMGSILGKIGFYAGRVNEDDNIEECCNAGDQPDFIILGGFQNIDDKKEFVGRVITNWCDKYPTDSLVYGDKIVLDQGGIAEDEDGNDLWISVSNKFPNLLNEINSLYDFLEIDSDDEHYNLSVEIPEEIRLFNLYEGYHMDIQEVEKGNGEKLGIEFYL
jgi:hypothetical protein